MNIKYFIVSFLLSNRVIIDSAADVWVDGIMDSCVSNQNDLAYCLYGEEGVFEFSANTPRECFEYIEKEYPMCEVQEM